MSATPQTNAPLCNFCNQSLSKYVCPRCNEQYCSLDCYKSGQHLECSELFYKNCVENELKLNQNIDNDRNILELLKKYSSITSNEDGGGDDDDDDDDSPLDSDDDSDVADLKDRMANVNLDDVDAVWNKLTSDEQQEFVAFLRSDDVGKLIPNWVSWWEQEHHKVEDITNKAAPSPYPSVRGIKKFSELSKKEPADCVQFNLFNVLGAYAFITRYFNGEYFEFAREAVACTVSISLNLNNNQNFYDFETAYKSIEMECLNSDWIATDKDNFINLKSDCFNLFKQKNFILYALSDLYKLFQVSLKPFNSEKSNFLKNFPNHFPNVKIIKSSKIKNLLKKLDYYLSYTNEYLILINNN